MSRDLPILGCSHCLQHLIRVTGVPENTTCKLCDRDINDYALLEHFGVYACGQRFRGAASVGDEGDVVYVNDFEFSECGMIVCVDCQRGSIGTLRARDVSRLISCSKQVAPGGAGAAAAAPSDDACPRCNPPLASSVIVFCDRHQNADGRLERPADGSTDLRWITTTSYRCERCHQAGEPDVDLSATGTRLLCECSVCSTRYFESYIGTPREPPARAGARRARSPEVKEERSDE